MTSTIFQLKKSNQIRFILNASAPSVPTKVQQKLSEIENALVEIASSKVPSLPFDILYRWVNDLCSQSDTKEQMQTIIDKTLHTLTNLIKTELVINNTLESLHQSYIKFSKILTLLRNILIPFDRISGKENIASIAQRLFRDDVIGSSISYVIDYLISLNDELRKNKEENVVVRGIVHMLEECKCQQQFEQQLFSSTTKHYQTISTQSRNNTLRSYINEVQIMIDREEEIATLHYPNQKRDCIAFCEKELIEEPIESLLISKVLEVKEFFKKKDTEAIQLLVRLATRVKKDDVLQHAFIDAIVAIGKDILSNLDDRSVMKNIILLYNYLSVLTPTHSLISNAVRSAFEKFINASDNRVAVALVKYVDQFLRKGNVVETEAEVVLHIFRFILGKDAFEKHYQLLLSKRLLFRGFSRDAEQMMLNKLREECGTSYTSKLEEMLKDVEVGKAWNNNLNNIMKNVGFNGAVGLTVINGTSWPPCPMIKCKDVSSEILQGQKSMEQWYVSNHQNRRLDFNPVLGIIECKCSIWNNAEITMNQLQFELLKHSTEPISIRQLKELFDGDDEIVQMTINSLILGKEKLLIRTTGNKDIKDDDIVTINMEYQPKKQKIKINNFQTQETREEKEKVDEKVIKDRQTRIDALVVRELTINELMENVVPKLGFKTDLDEINQRIDSLIEREYVERSPEDGQKLVYLA
ncbi:Cullin [Entamoeba marina]